MGLAGATFGLEQLAKGIEGKRRNGQRKGGGIKCGHNHGSIYP
jgi:hypothetical protein